MYDPCHRRGKYGGLYSAVLRYVTMREEPNIKPEQLVEEHSIFYNLKDPGYKREAKLIYCGKN
jgi:hypothetical protein